jgi:hypothetical protein
LDVFAGIATLQLRFGSANIDISLFPTTNFLLFSLIPYLYIRQPKRQTFDYARTQEQAVPGIRKANQGPVRPD